MIAAHIAVPPDLPAQPGASDVPSPRSDGVYSTDPQEWRPSIAGGAIISSTNLAPDH